MRVLKSFLAVCCLVSVVGLGYAKMAVQSDPLSRLFEGNNLFVADTLAKKEVGQARREELTKGQHPFATVITCSDSRVAPEYIFDQGLGDIFVIRVAGNVIEPTTLSGALSTQQNTSIRLYWSLWAILSVVVSTGQERPFITGKE
jgi:carbonic anhydrase